MTWTQLVGVCVGTAAVLAAAYALGRFVRDLAHGMRRLSRMLDDWLGEPEHPGMPGSGRPGVLARLGGVEDRLGGVETRLVKLNALERRMAAVESRLPPLDGPPRLEAGGTGFQAERVPEEIDAGEPSGVRLPYGFIEQHSR